MWVEPLEGLPDAREGCCLDFSVAANGRRIYPEFVSKATADAKQLFFTNKAGRTRSN